MLVANYVTDLGVVVGVYPMRVGSDPNNNPLLSFLPSELLDSYFELRNTKGCRVTGLQPRKLRLTFSDNFDVDVELPITPTLEQVIQFRDNTGASRVVTIGEDIKYRRLRWLAGDTTA